MSSSPVKTVFYEMPQAAQDAYSELCGGFSIGEFAVLDDAVQRVGCSGWKVTKDTPSHGRSFTVVMTADGVPDRYTGLCEEYIRVLNEHQGCAVMYFWWACWAASNGEELPRGGHAGAVIRG